MGQKRDDDNFNISQIRAEENFKNLSEKKLVSYKFFKDLFKSSVEKSSPFFISPNVKIVPFDTLTLFFTTISLIISALVILKNNAKLTAIKKILNISR